jgi:hypothetical protein
MFGSPGSCSQLQPTTSNLPANSTLSPPVSPPGVSYTPPPPPAAAAGNSGQHTAAAACSDTAGLQVQHTGDSDCSGASLAAAQPIAGCSSSGSMQAPQICSPLIQPLPPVTMVFMAVEGPELLVRRRRTFTPRVQALLSRVVRDALRRLGGYLCRVQEGDMKFMVAFASPVTALEWCLLVQVSVSTAGADVEMYVEPHTLRGLWAGEPGSTGGAGAGCVRSELSTPVAEVRGCSYTVGETSWNGWGLSDPPILCGCLVCVCAAVFPHVRRRLPCTCHGLSLGSCCCPAVRSTWTAAGAWCSAGQDSRWECVSGLSLHSAQY